MVSQRIKPYSGEFDTRDLADVSRKALGVNEDNYQFAPGLESDRETALKKAAFSLGLHPHQAKKFLDKTVEVLNDISEERTKSTLSEHKKKLNIEGDIDKTLSERFAEKGRSFENYKKVLGDSVYNPEVLDLLEGKSDTTGATSTGNTSPETADRDPKDVERQIDAIVASKDYNDPTSDKFTESHDKVQQLEMSLGEGGHFLDSD